MYGYVVRDVTGGFDFGFTLALSEARARSKFLVMVNARRVIVHPMHDLEIRKITGLTQEDFDAATAGKDG